MNARQVTYADVTPDGVVFRDQPIAERVRLLADAAPGRWVVAAFAEQQQQIGGSRRKQHRIRGYQTITRKMPDGTAVLLVRRPAKEA